MEPTAPSAREHELLERFVTIADAALAEVGWHHPHVLVRVERTVEPAAFRLYLKELPEGAHPADELWGFTAPEHWAALGVVSFGWAAPAGEGRPSLHAARTRARVTILVDRDGNEASTASFDDGTAIDDPGEGLIGDVLRRCLGLPTAPPPPVERLADLLWLRAVSDAVSGPTAERPLGWAAVSALRPRPDWSATWSRCREMAAASGHWPLALTWMDDGFFARQVLARLPSVDESLAAVEGCVSERAMRKLRAALAR